MRSWAIFSTNVVADEGISAVVAYDMTDPEVD